MTTRLHWAWLGALVTALGVRAADWPMFRGNAAQHGVAEGALPAKPRVLWTFDAGSPVKAPAVIASGKVIVGGSDGRLFALGLSDGKPLWTSAVSNAIESAALVLGDTVYASDNGGLLRALRLADGVEKWRYEAEAEMPGGCTWFIAGGRTNLLAGSHDFRLHCVDAATGRSNWVYETENYINGVPALEKGKACFGGCDSLVHVVDVTTGTKLGTTELGAPVAASGALRDGRLYQGHYGNEFVCIDIEKSEVVWRYAFRQFPFMTSPAVVGNRVLAGGRDKHLHCLNAADGSLIWRYRAGNRIDSSPVVCGDQVVFGCDDGRLYLVGLEKGEERWTYDLGKPVSASPAVADGHLVIGGTDGRIWCFGP